MLFNPEIVGLEYAGVHQVVVDSINRADLDLRKSLFGNVVLSGGGTLVKGPSPSIAPAQHTLINGRFAMQASATACCTR